MIRSYHNSVFRVLVALLIASFFIIFCFVALLVLQPYVSGPYYRVRALLNRNALVAPPQDVYNRNPKIIVALQLVARRWNTRPEALYVLTFRPTTSAYGLDEFGIVDSSSFASARFLVPAQLYSNLQSLSKDSIAYEGDVYLSSEFIPKTSQELDMARLFYATEPAFANKFAVIGWQDIDLSGDGHVTALIDSGYVNFAVRHHVIIKSHAWLN